MTVEHVRGETGLTDFLRNAKSRPALVQFFATWCGPCHRMMPVVEAMASKYSGKAVFAKIDSDESKDCAMAHGIRALPTFLLFHQGKKIAEMQGADSAKLEAMVADAVKKYNVFAASAGHSLVGSSSSVPSKGTASSTSTGDSGIHRVNPWADPNFVPPYLRRVQDEEAKKKAEIETKKAVEVESKKIEESKVSSSAAGMSDAEIDIELQKALELSVAESSDLPPKSNDPSLKFDKEMLAKLLEFEFPRIRAEKALILTQSKSIEAAMEWLIAHSEDPDVDEPLTIVDTAAASAAKVKGAPLGYKPGEAYDDDDGDLIAQVRKEKEKKKADLLKSIGDERPMSELTKEEKLERIEKLKHARKDQKSASEIAASRIAEKERRKQVKESVEARRAREEAEAARAARAKKREKEEEKLRRQKILDKIAADKARKAGK